MKIPKSQRLKNPTIVHVGADVGDEAVDADVDPTVLAKKLHAASDLLRQLVDQNGTRMISKTTIWILMQN